MTSLRNKTALWLPASLVLLSGCGVVQSNSDAGPGVTDAGAVNTDAGPVCGSTGGVPCTVTIKDFKYDPETLVVAPGAVVTVKNMDVMVHTATSETAQGSFIAGASSGISFDTGNIQGGQTGTFTVPANATVGKSVYYICTVHFQAMANEPHIIVAH